LGISGRITTQYTPDALIAGEQLGLGGATSVRGYREREIAGDSGLIATLEGFGPEWGKVLKAEGASLRALLFADFGWVHNNKNAPCFRTHTNCSLSSVGAGIRFGLGKWLIGRLDVGYALDDSTQKTSGSTHGHLALNLVF